MEGPTPISALIHAATMVTAGIFMVTRMAPLFEMSQTALSVVLVIGATTALFMGLIGIVQNDIKRVVAYSTLSQLGYMTVALGASAYSAAIYHLMTHAFFKALLFLGAGSVIIAMHHEQDIRRMGGLRKYLPITFVTAWIGTLALIGFPGFSGFYSKDAILYAVQYADRPGASYAYACVLIGVFITSFYSFRLLFLTFHGKERFASSGSEHAAAHAHGHDPGHDVHGHDKHGAAHGHAHAPHESTWVVTLPLVLLAIPSLAIGALGAHMWFVGDFLSGIQPAGVEGLKHISEHLEHGWMSFALHGFATLPVWLALLGMGLAALLYLVKTEWPAKLKAAFGPLHTLLDHKYYFDEFYQAVFARGSVMLGKLFWRVGDQGLIDGVAVNGAAGLIEKLAYFVRRLQSGYLYQYAFLMILGLIAAIGYFVVYLNR